jgi:hypothetical protein
MTRLLWRSLVASALGAGALLAGGPALATSTTLLPPGGRGIDVMPTSIDFRSAVRGAEYSAPLVVTNLVGEDQVFQFDADGDVASWMRLVDEGYQPTGEVLVPSGQRGGVNLVVAVPASAPNGTYRGDVVVSATPPDGSDRSVGYGAVVSVTLDVGGDMKVDATLNGVTAAAVEIGQPLVVKANVTNLGNVSVTPVVTVTITRNSFPVDRVANESAPRPVFPGLTEDALVRWDTAGALPGAYDLDVEVRSGDLVLGDVALVAELLAPGTAPRSGDLTDLALANRPIVGGPAVVRGQFANTSRVPVEAVLLLEVFRDGELVESLESVRRVVEPRGSANLDVTIEALADADHRAVGRVNFDGRETEAREVTFRPGEQPAGAGAVAASTAGSGPWGALAASVLVVLGASAAGWWLLRRRPKRAAGTVAG